MKTCLPYIKTFLPFSKTFLVNFEIKFWHLWATVVSRTKWNKNTMLVVGDLILYGIEEKRLSSKVQVKANHLLYKQRCHQYC